MKGSLKTHILLLLATIFWGVSPAFMKLGLQEMDVFIFSTWRLLAALLISGLLLLTFGTWKKVEKSDWKLFIIIGLFVDDKTKLPESEWITAKYDGKVKKTIGKKNLAFQIDKYETNGQPYYHILSPDEVALQSTYQYDLDIDNLIEYLNGGIEKFKK